MLSRRTIRQLSTILALALLLTVPGVSEDDPYSDPIKLDVSLPDDDINLNADDFLMEPDLTLDLSIETDMPESPGPENVTTKASDEVNGENDIPKSLTLGVKETRKLKSKNRTFKSSKPAIATVDQKGVITARKKGTAKITVMSGKKTLGTCKVTVVAAPKKVGLDIDAAVLGAGETLALTPTIPQNSHAGFTYTTKDKRIASVSAKGVITARRVGSTSITVSTHNGRKASLKLTVMRAPTKVTVKPKALALEVGQTTALTAKLPNKSAAYRLTWSSSDEGVATVDANGLVTAISAGSADIVVRTYNKKKATCAVTVTEPVEEPTPEPPSGWRLTQYPDASGKNGLFYSLVNQANGTLILVDGGWAKNARTVRKVIDENGGKVKAWFLTHYHGDHIGAFNKLYGKYKDKIETVYVNPLDWDTFESVAMYWDTPEEFAAFLEQTAGADNVVRLHRGDDLDIDGIHIHVFSAFDDIVRDLAEDWPNNSSLVFKLSLARDSVLFLGDLTYTAEALCRHMLDTYGAEALHADYVQAGHHGNRGPSTDFYGAIHPRVMFLDGPEWLMTSENYTARDLLAWCAENGIKTYDYRQAPSSFTLE